MNISTKRAPIIDQRRHRGRYRQCAAWFLILSFLGAGCTSDNGPAEGSLGFVRGFLGGVAADEPRAATVGRDVLSAGGNAVDAAVAVFFTMAVTRPSVAGLGSSGQCLVFNDGSKRVDALDFVAPAGVPGAPRALFALHAKYGQMRWEQLVGFGENLARFGFPVSRGFARDLAGSASVIARSPELARLYRQGNGAPLDEGAFLQQLDLAATLAVLRRAPGDFYAGAFARQYVEAAQSRGIPVTAEAMRGYTPQWRDTITVSHGLLTNHFTPDASGAYAAALWTALAAQGGYERARDDGKSAAIGEAALRALSAGTGQEALDRPPSGASFVVADRYSATVACAFSMGRPFGAGQAVPGTGVIPAAPAGDGLGSAAMLSINPRVNKMFFAAAATGSGAPTAMISSALGVLIAEADLAAALAAPRVHPVAPSTIVSEPQLSLGIVNGFHCPKGMVSPGGEKPEAICQVATDRRGFGMAIQK